MNVQELKAWATKNYALDNEELLKAGVKERCLTKIKPHLRSIIDKSTEIIKSTESNNRKIEVINSDIKHLISWGLPPIEEEKKEEETPAPSVEETPKPEEPEEPKASDQPETKKGWYSKR